MKWGQIVVLGTGLTLGLDALAQGDSSLPFTIPDAFEGQVFATEPMLRNPVAISVAADGKVYVTETARRKSANLDIRANADWIEQELSLESVADKIAFYQKELAPERSESNRGRVADYNNDGSHDWRDLTVLSERIHELRDEDGDGVADTASVYAEDLRGVVTEIAGGVLAHDGAVYATVAPDVWRFLDRDGDGVSDSRESIAQGFAVHVAYAGHNMHGLTVGPDGRLYWSIGDTGSDARPHEGAVFRCELDGSGFEVFARGLRNPQELAFDQFGNLFTGDNDADFGDRERWVHVVYGGDYGWRFWWQYQRGEKWRAPDSDYSVWMEEKLWHPAFPGQAAYILPGEKWIDNGPCGVTFNPGGGLGEAYRNTFFMAHFTGSTGNSSVRSYKLEPRGATYAVLEDKPFLGQAVITGLDFAPDGSALFAADWAGSWPKNEQGRVYRMSHPDHRASSEVMEARAFLNADIGELDPKALQAGLRSLNRNVRLAAQFELARRPEGQAALTRVALSSAEPQLARLSAIWGLGMIARREGSQPSGLVPLFEDSDAEVRAQAAHVAGDAAFAAAEPHLIALLEDREPRVVFHAAMALANLGSEQAVEPVTEGLARWGEGDRFLRFAGIRVFERGASPQRLASLDAHPSVPVRLAAAVALRRLEDPLVARFARDSDPLVAAEAARAINDVPIVEGRSSLAGALELGLRGVAFDRRALNANYRLGDATAARRVIDVASRIEAPEDIRIEAMRLLLHWEEPSPRDRVCGGWFEDLDLDGRVEGPAFQSMVAERLDALLIGSPATQDAAGKLLESIGESADIARLMEWVSSDSGSVGLRRGALRLIALRHEGFAEQAAMSVLEANIPALTQEGLLALGSVNPGKAWELAVATVEGSGPIAVRQAAVRAVGEIDAASRDVLARRWLTELRGGKLPSAMGLELLALEGAGSALDWEALNLEQEAETNRSFLLEGGDAERGAEIFRNKVELQCLRCHQASFGGRSMGGTMGPGLVGLSQRTDRAHILASILDPNAEIAEGFATALLTLRSGETVYGQILEETESEAVIGVPALSGGTEGAEAGAMTLNKRTIPISEIEARVPGVSGMPPGLWRLMTPFELRDLIEFVGSQ